MSKILVAGGAGYIGSHMAAALQRAGYDPVVADNLSTGHREAVKFGAFYEGDLRDPELLDRIFTENRIEGVIDFAACSLVEESTRDPIKYYSNNVDGMLSVVGAMARRGVEHIVFSSTAAVYGEPEKQPIEEEDRKLPSNPYGESKLAIERLLHWCEKAYGIKYAALRYFNAAGADNEARIGEAHSPETHLIPIVLQAALGQRDKVRIFGGDYPTPDGTCVRDYVDVRDLADAHLRALRYLWEGGESGAFNLGSGSGCSVREIIEAARRATGREIAVERAERRAGDPSVLVASNAKAAERLGWIPRHGELEDIIGSAWVWHSSQKAY